jgi:hypothetical protein
MQKQQTKQCSHKIQFPHTAVDLQRFPQRLASLVAYTVAQLHRRRQPPSLPATTQQPQIPPLNIQKQQTKQCSHKIQFPQSAEFAGADSHAKSNAIRR